jgi:dipeptidyl aminopeptidase/acylaminoacyl peptidase
LSPRFVKVTITLLVVALLLATAYVIVPKLGTGHRHIDTAGKIVFLSDADIQGKPHVYVVGCDGTGLKDLTPGAQSCADPSFSPDGSQITYVSDKLGPQQVYVMDADGQHPHAITIGSAAKSTPQFSSDGKSVAYIAAGTVTSIDLQSNDTDLLLPAPSATTTNNPTAVIDLSHDAVDAFQWSPSTSASGSQEIVAVQEQVGVPGQPDGDVLTLLPAPNAPPIELITGENITFTWSPDGTKIYAAVLGTHVGPQQQPFSAIVTFSSDGKPLPSSPVAVSNSLTIGPTSPAISPDGKTILFNVVNNPDLAHNTIIGLYTQPLDGSQLPTKVIEGPAKGALWSPDGKYLLVLLPRSSIFEYDLWSKEIGDDPPVNLTQGAGNVTWAEWSPSIEK